ncbi:hypothetical protein ScalyP_jg2209, partial [Parmales sp. scaly parma]
ILEELRTLNGVAILQNGSADIYALMSTSDCLRFLGGKGKETRIESLFGAKSIDPLARIDTYRNDISPNIAGCLGDLIPNARISLSLTNLSSLLSEIPNLGFKSIGVNAHSAEHDARTTLEVALLYARSVKEGTVGKLCEYIQTAFFKIAENDPDAAVKFLTEAGVDALVTFKFVGGKSGLRSGVLKSLQVAGRRS